MVFSMKTTRPRILRFTHDIEAKKQRPVLHWQFDAVFGMFVCTIYGDHVYTAIHIKIVFHVAGCCSTAAIRSMTINLILISHFRSYVTFFCFFHCDTNDCKHNDCHKCHLICMPFSQYVLFVFLSCICHTQDSLCLFAIEMQFLKS